MPYIVQVYIYAIIDALRFGTQFKVGQLLDKLKSKFFSRKKIFFRNYGWTVSFEIVSAIYHQHSAAPNSFQNFILEFRSHPKACYTISLKFYQNHNLVVVRTRTMNVIVVGGCRQTREANGVRQRQCYCCRWLQVDERSLWCTAATTTPRTVQVCTAASQSLLKVVISANLPYVLARVM